MVTTCFFFGLNQGSLTWCSRASNRPQGSCKSPAGLF